MRAGTLSRLAASLDVQVQQLPYWMYILVISQRGVFKGGAESELSVTVQVTPSNKPLPEETSLTSVIWISSDCNEQMEEQQQQQQ